MSLHIHLPSLHVRRADGSGFDYEEDLLIPEVDELGDDELLGEMHGALDRGYMKPVDSVGGVCAVCGCTDDDPCTGHDGEPCHWVTPTLCSACLEL